MIELSECRDTKTWHEFLKKENGTQLITIAHNPSLGPILEKTFGYESQNMLINKNDEVIGVLPLVKIGKKLVSMPHFSYGGPILDSSSDEASLDLSKVLDSNRFEARSFDKLTENLYEGKVSCILKLKNNQEEQLMYFKSGFRRKIRKSEKYNFKVVCGKMELLDEFYDVYTKKMLHKGSPPLGKSFFQNLLLDYKYGEALITAVYHGDEIIAGGFTLSYLGFNEICWVSTNSDYDKYNVNSFLYWNIVKDSIQKNYTYFSLGRSTKNSSNHLYKRQWKPMEIPIFYNYSEPVGKSLKEFSFLTKIWKLQPLSTSVYFGRIVSKYVY
ncbi:MAG: lipid II:glycine glycyltransferase (peptidoglycan interpeptide bridge formation enzyme) [Maribacter sp.]|jgi:lipid II:glycine glycyltransferase (peptidoglycan interpeptide bridge formation enzyme)